MRLRFAQTLVRLAEHDPRIVLLTGDLGYSVLEPFCDAHPDRFFNVGVAEQNMIGLATGLAEAGFIPFTYSISTFASMRPYEFIRHGPVAHRLPVRMIGVGAGFDYGHNGLTHFALEDIALMRAQPDLTVVAPADADQAETALVKAAELPGPVYFRLAREGEAVPGLFGRFEFGEAVVLREGSDLAFVALGNSAHDAVAAAETLAARGISSSVAVVASVNPPPTADLVRLLANVPLVISVESHYIVGGLGSLVAELIAEHNLSCRLVRCGVRQVPRHQTGAQPFLNSLHGLTPDALVSAALRELVVPVA